MDTKECRVDFATLLYSGEKQHFDFCSSQARDPSMKPYVCPYLWETCASSPCGGMVDFDLEDGGCTFSNPKVLTACEYAAEQEDFAWPCKEGFDYYAFGEEDAYSDSTLVSDNG